MAEDGKVNMNLDEYKKLIKKYKKTKKYMKSNLFAIKTMDGTEKFVSELMKEAEGYETESN
tara:strand:- start:1078 stop:1260 length:183 start_codon:yes stop_codon:yes gene_type:complete